MKKSLFFSIALVCGTILFAQKPSWETLHLLPDAAGFLPQAASTVENNQHVTVIESLQAYDEDIYQTAKLLRETDRGIQAEYEEPYQALPSRFAEVMEADIADATTFPKINALIKACIDLKDFHTDYYMKDGVETEGLRSQAILRARPRDQFVHQDESYNKTETSSYPSGHGYAEWLVASCLAYIHPAKSTQIYAIAPEYGFSRVIIAAHWMTDINAGERLAAAAFPTLVSNSDFLQLLNEARTEYQNYKTNNPSYTKPQVTIGDDFNWATAYPSYAKNSDGTMTILRRYNGQHINVTLGRTFKGGMWNTVCLPFSLETLEDTPFAGAQVIAFTNATIQDAQAGGQELVLNFEPVTSMRAGVSYLVNVGSEDLTNPTFNNVLLLMKDPHVQRVNLDFTRDITHNGITFHGVINKKTISGNTLFLGDNNTLFYPSSSGTIKGFRAYFELPATATHMPARISLHQGGSTTDIISMTPEADSQGGALAPKKLLQDGEIVITDGDKAYMINGRSIY